MEYLKEYDNKQKQNKRNFIKQIVIDKLDNYWIKKGQKSQKALYFNRVLKATGINIEQTKISVLEIGGGMVILCHLCIQTLKERLW